MSVDLVVEMCSQALFIVIKTAAPVLLVSLIIGLTVSVFQTMTSIQEQTLTFVPKIVAIMLVVALTGPFVGGQISAFTNVVFERIQHGF